MGSIYSTMCRAALLPEYEMLSKDTYWEVGHNIDLELKASVLLSEGTTRRKFFVYLLLKSNELYKLKELARTHFETSELIWQLIISTIYIGKGHGDRPLQHLKNALSDADSRGKVGEIKEVWRAGNDIVIWRSFQNSTSQFEV